MSEASMRDRVPTDEWQRRVHLAALFRYAAYRQWDDHLFTHMSTRVPGSDGDILLNPIGLLFEEVTASSLHRLDRNGEHVYPSSARAHNFVFPLHRAVYDAVAAADCVVHLHAEPAVAVSMQPQGLQPASQYALLAGRIGYHEYEGIAMGKDELLRLAKGLAEHDCLMLKGHGVIVRGRSIYEAFIRTHHLIKACEVQLATQACGEALYVTSKEARAVTEREVQLINNGDAPLGQASWQAVLRKLDRLDPGYRN